MQFSSLPTSVIVLSLCAAAAAIGFFGVSMTRAARDLAHRTGLGQAFVGVFLVGAATSLSGNVTSISAAAAGHAELSVSNALGGIAAQTAFLAIADVVYRRANLEHAAASVENLIMCAFLLLLLGIHLVGFATPDIALGEVHPASFLVIAAYGFGLYVLLRTHRSPMWLPRVTSDTVREPTAEAPAAPRRVGSPVVVFLVSAVVVGAAGWLLAGVAVPFAERTGLSEGFVGGTITAVATSLPELVIVVSAVRLGALNLAIGDIVGGNAFDTLIIAFSDIAYRQGSIYSGVSAIELVWLAVTVLMSCVFLLGLLYRERRGVGNIGVEGVGLLAIYSVSAGLIAFMA